MKCFFVLFLSLLACTTHAQDLIGTIDHNIYREEKLPPDSVIWVRPSDQAKGTANIDFYGRTFVEIFRAKFPNAYWENDLPEELEPNSVVTFKVVEETGSGTYKKKLYSNQPSGIKCKDTPFGIECDYKSGERALTGTTEESYTFYKFAILLSWFFRSSNDAAFTSMGTMLADTARSNTHCTKSEAFTILGKQLVERIVVDRPVEARYSIASAKRAGCGTN